MLPLTLVKAANGSPLLVELKDGDTYNGRLVSADAYMNMNLSNVICTVADGSKFYKLPSAYIRGSAIKYLRLPDTVLEQAKELAQKEEEQQQQNRNQQQYHRGGGGRGPRGAGGGRGRGGYSRGDGGGGYSRGDGGGRGGRGGGGGGGRSRFSARGGGGSNRGGGRGRQEGGGRYNHGGGGRGARSGTSH
ncbi:hypothetical protein ACA910_001046 [Epithemia clementina (nom. ined.)]